MCPSRLSLRQFNTPSKMPRFLIENETSIGTKAEREVWLNHRLSHEGLEPRDDSLWVEMSMESVSRGRTVAIRERRFQFVEDAWEGHIPAISCDCLVPGAALDVTHWQGNRTPGKYKADTSTEIALNFAGSPQALDEWADAVVVNNHFDTDGLLSIWVLLDPEQAMAYRDLLIAAAVAGDFDEWPTLDRGLWLDATIRALGPGAGDDAAAYEKVLPQLPELIHRVDERRDLWGREWDDLQAAVTALEASRLRAESTGATGLMVHSPGQSEAPGPLLSRQFLPGARRYLLAFDRGDGRYDYRYERPHYAWADTVVRPVLAPPDTAAVAAAMGPDWTDKDLPGMTGIVRTGRPVSEQPEAVIQRLLEIDQGAPGS
jgi:hypothetical protein